MLAVTDIAVEVSTSMSFLSVPLLEQYCQHGDVRQDAKHAGGRQGNDNAVLGRRHPAAY